MEAAYRSAALAMMQGLPDYRSLSYLEMGCGDGYILDTLHRAGAKVRGTTYLSRDQDYIRTRDYPADLPVDGGIDLNRPLPYPDASFDVVYSTEVIEHVESHTNFLCQAARVLKPNGVFILTSPNLHRILSRFAFALSGVHRTKQVLTPWSYPLGRMSEFHHRCVDFPFLHWVLWQNGLRIEGIATTEVKTISRAALVLWPLLNVVTKRSVVQGVLDSPIDRAARADLIKWMMSSALLTSEQFCVRARENQPPVRLMGRLSP